MPRFFLPLLLALLLFFPALGQAETPEPEGQQIIAPETLVDLAADHIEASLSEALETRRFKVAPTHAPRPVRAPEGEITYEVTTPNGLRYWGNTAVYIRILVDGEPLRQVILPFKIHMYDRVAVAARPLRARQVLTEADIRFEEQEIGTKEQRYFFDAADLVGQVITRGLAAGQPILRALVKKPVLIEAGAPVTIVANVNGVEVKTEGVALEPGREGDVIRARNQASRRVVRVRVLDAETVEVLSR